MQSTNEGMPLWKSDPSIKNEEHQLCHQSLFLVFMMFESIQTFSLPEWTKPRQLLVLEGFDTTQSQEWLTLRHQ